MMDFLLDYGYIGLFIGAFLAATILPMSSDVLLVGLLAVGADPYLCVNVVLAWPSRKMGVDRKIFQGQKGDNRETSA